MGITATTVRGFCSRVFCCRDRSSIEKTVLKTDITNCINSALAARGKIFAEAEGKELVERVSIEGGNYEIIRICKEKLDPTTEKEELDIYKEQFGLVKHYFGVLKKHESSFTDAQRESFKGIADSIDDIEKNIIPELKEDTIMEKFGTLSNKSVAVGSMVVTAVATGFLKEAVVGAASIGLGALGAVATKVGTTVGILGPAVAEQSSFATAKAAEAAAAVTAAKAAEAAVAATAEVAVLTKNMESIIGVARTCADDISEEALKTCKGVVATITESDTLQSIMDYKPDFPIADTLETIKENILKALPKEVSNTSESFLCNGLLNDGVVITAFLSVWLALRGSEKSETKALVSAAGVSSLAFAVLNTVKRFSVGEWSLDSAILTLMSSVYSGVTTHPYIAATLSLGLAAAALGMKKYREVEA
jgi:hypothetical protein